MRIGIGFGRDRVEVEVEPDNLVQAHGSAGSSVLSDPAEAVRQALDKPHDFPSLRRALTPDDHVAVIVDEQLPQLTVLLLPLLEHVLSAGVAPAAIALVCLPGAKDQPWIEDLPDAFQEVRLEVHNPTDRRHLSYLATTRLGRRIYLNRTVVDADQVVVLSGRSYDPLLGYGGAEGMLYPVLSDEETRQAAGQQLSMQVPGKEPWPWRRQAVEVAWLLGAPFLVQVIPGAEETVHALLGGPVETSALGQRLLDAHWRLEVEQASDVVVAGMAGDPAGHTFADFGRALACAARVVKPEGSIVLLSGAAPALGPSAALIRQAEDPAAALHLLHEHQPQDMAAGFQWASAAQQARIFLLSGWPAEVTEELLAVPLEHAGQLQRLLTADALVLFLPDAHKTLAVLCPAS